MNLTSKDIENLRHALGASKNKPKRNWGYRNRFCAPKQDDAPNYQSMLRLVGAGYMEAGQLIGEQRDSRRSP